MTGLLIGFYFREKSVYIGINTMEAIGMPKYVHCYVNEDDKCIFLEGCEKDLDAARVRCQRNRVTGYLYYTFSAPGFLKWMAENIVMRRDPVGNIKPDKDKSTEKIDGIVAAIMALDRCIKNANTRGSIYDERGIISV